MNSPESVKKNIHLVLLDKIRVGERLRSNLVSSLVGDFQTSFQKSPGLFSAIGVKEAEDVEGIYDLIYGETRLTAIKTLHFLRLPAYYNGEVLPQDFMPVLILPKGLTKAQYLRIEMEENSMRKDFTIQDLGRAVKKVAMLEMSIEEAEKVEEAEKLKEKENLVPPQTPQETTSSRVEDEETEEVHAPSSILNLFQAQKPSAEIMQRAAEKIFPDLSPETAKAKAKLAVTVVDAIDSGSPLGEALKGVSTDKEAREIIKAVSVQDLRATLTRHQGQGFSSKRFNLILGDCVEELPKLEHKSFDVCITDTLSGVEKNIFRVPSLGDVKETAFEEFMRVTPLILKSVSKLCKDKAHLYLSCDINNYHLLKEMVLSSCPNKSWQIPSAPFIQYNPQGGRVIYPGFTPRSSYSVWLYAYREKQEYKTINDVLELDPTIKDPYPAEKPIEALKALLSRSTTTGDSVLDFMAGSGNILKACHDLKLVVTAIEKDPAYFERMQTTVKGLI